MDVRDAPVVEQLLRRAQQHRLAFALLERTDTPDDERAVDERVTNQRLHAVIESSRRVPVVVRVWGGETSAAISGVRLNLAVSVPLYTLVMLAAGTPMFSTMKSFVYWAIVITQHWLSAWPGLGSRSGLG